MRSPRTIPEEKFIRSRENPYFTGLLRKSHEKVNDDDANSILSDISSDLIATKESHKLSKIANAPTTTTTPFAFQSQFTLDLYDSIKQSPPNANHYNIFQKSYTFHTGNTNLSKIPLPQCAASFYQAFPLVEIVESCDGIKRLNLYLKATRDDVNAGVPGRFLNAVLAHDVNDVGSIVSTIMYAFYLNQTLDNQKLCTAPVINMKRADLRSHAELNWLLDSCQLDDSSFLFVDEIDLSYYDLFGSLKLVLMNGYKLPPKQEALKEAVVEIFNCRKGDSLYPWVKTVTLGQDSSCCALVAEKFALTLPEILAGRGFSRLLLAGILLDTGNLGSPHCTTQDKYMATLLINGAGRFGPHGLYEILRYKMCDVSDLRIGDILRKDFKKWTRGGKRETGSSRMTVSNIGMSSIGVPIHQLLSHEHASTEEIKYFQELEKLRLFVIVSGYYDPQKNFKREILITAESLELMKNLLLFLNSNASQLPLKEVELPGVKDVMKAFEIDKVTSRKTIEYLLEEFDVA